jgi:hypothetical protein
MINAAVFNKLRIGAIALAAGLALSTTTLRKYGGVAGGACGAGGGYGGNSAPDMETVAATAGTRRGGYGDARFGYGGFGYYGGFGFLGYGLFFDAHRSITRRCGGATVDYYHANDNYYQWNGAVSMRPCAHRTSRARLRRPGVRKLQFVRQSVCVPQECATTEQLATDRSECQHWATDQTGSALHGR